MARRKDANRPLGNLLALAVLTYLTERPMHAYELHRLLKERDAARTFKLSYGALYSVVRQLERERFIAAVEVNRTGRHPEHTVYRLTDAGREEMDSWLRELLAAPRHEYPAFAAALSLVVVLHPQAVTEALRTRLGRVEAAVSDTERQRDEVLGRGVHPLFLVEDDYRLALLRAEAAFVRELLDRIDDPATGWASAWREYAEQTTSTEGRQT